MIGNIYIKGQIGHFKDVAGVELIHVIEQVKNQPEATSFDVHINSEGGVVEVGYQIYEYLKSLDKPVRTIGSGVVMSIATAIFMAGEQRTLMPNTSFMIHVPWARGEGNAQELEEFLKVLKKEEEKLIDFYVKALNIERAAIEPLLRSETWLTNEQALSLGFVTKAAEPILAKAYLKTDNKMSETLTEKDKSWIDKKFEAILAAFSKKDIVSKIVQDANGASIEFTDVADDAEIEKGMKATIDGNPAEGEIVMPDGKTYVFEAGELKEIKEAEEDEVAALKKENADLKAELEQVQASHKKELDTIKNDVLALQKKVKSTFTVDDKKVVAKNKNNEEGTDRTSGLKEYLNNKNKR